MHAEAIEADLFRFYGLDLLADLGGPRLTWRRLGSLLRFLPREAATVQEVQGGTAEWGAAEHLLASVVDGLGVVAHHALIGPHVDPKKLRAIKPPKPLERPGQVRRKKRKATADELRQMFADSWSNPRVTPAVANWQQEAPQ